jgi:nucleoside 2-deoxyribosyltransferase
MADISNKLTIYFAGSIRGGRDDAGRYARFIGYLKTFGRVLTEHVGEERLLEEENSLTEREIFERDMQWMARADLLIAEVSTPSLGVGYEIAVAEAMDKPIYCLCRPGGTSLSAMIAGNPMLEVRSYTENEEAEEFMSQWISAFRQKRAAGEGRQQK